MDSIEPDAMLALLTACAKGPAPAAQLRQLLGLPGARLLLKEQNRLGIVTEEQYLNVLDAACQGKIVEVQPAEPSARGKAGARLLKEQVAPAIVWGRKNIEALQARLTQLRLDGGIKRTASVAERNLPEKTILAPRYYFVMGSPVETAAIDNEMYIDVLQSLWRAGRHQPVLSPHDVLVFFADEAHHAGYRKILDRKQNALALSPAESQTWDFLQAIMVQGSATLLIDADEKPDDLAKLSDLKPQLKRAPKLLAGTQRILDRALKGPLPEKDYAQAEKIFSGKGYAAAGAVLLSAIEKKRGRDGVMEVMADPRQLLSAYNDCAESSTVKFRFDHGLAERVANIGSHTAN